MRGNDMSLIIGLIVAAVIVVGVIVAIAVTKSINEKKYRELESEALKKLNYSNWDFVSYFDESVIVKSRQTLEKYDDIKFFKEDKSKLSRAKKIIKRKKKSKSIYVSFSVITSLKNIRNTIGLQNILMKKSMMQKRIEFV